MENSTEGGNPTSSNGLLSLHRQLKEEQHIITSDRYVIGYLQKILADEKKNMKNLMLSIQFQLFTPSNTLSTSNGTVSVQPLSITSPNVTPNATRRSANDKIEGENSLLSPTKGTYTHQRSPSSSFKASRALRNFFSGNSEDEESSRNSLESKAAKSSSNLNEPPKPSSRTSFTNVHDVRVKKRMEVMEELYSTVQMPMLRILERCREDPKFLASAIASHGFLHVKKNVNSANLRKLSSCIVTSVFSNCWSSNEEAKFLRFVESLVDQMEELNTFENRKSFKMPDFFSEIVNCYIKCTRVREYLSIIMGDIVTKHFATVEKKSDQNLGSPSENSRGRSVSFSSSLIQQVEQRIFSTIDSLPYGIRIIARKLASVGEKLGWTESEINAILLRDLLIFSFFMPCLLRPNLYSSTHIGDSSDVAIVEINKVANHLNRIDVNEDPRWTKYFKEIVSHLNPHQLDYEIGTFPSSFDEEICPFFLIPKVDFELLLRVLMTSKVSELEQYSEFIKVAFQEDKTEEELAEFTKKLSSQLQKYQKLHQDTLIVLNRTLIEVIPIPPTPPKENSVVKEGKKKLSHVLSQLICLIGVGDDTPVVECLEAQQKYWNKDAQSLSAQIYDTVRCLGDQSMPQEFKDDNYLKIIKEMFLESKDRLKKQNEYKLRIRKILDYAQTHVHKLTLVKQDILQSNVFKHLESYTKLYFDSDRDEFIKVFEKNHLGSANSKTCQCTILEGENCESCLAKSRAIKGFLNAQRLKLESEVFTEGTVEEEQLVKIAVRQLEQNLMSKLHSKLFVHVIEDYVLCSKIQACSGLSPEDFRIPTKLQTDAPWLYAQRELMKINCYVAPYDKFQCISNSWEILQGCVSMLDDPGPDALWTIMAFIIHAVNNPDFLSNVQYEKPLFYFEVSRVLILLLTVTLIYIPLWMNWNLLE
eukprot:TRINITY_DN1706_c0_g1_i2.p1 TRINITY_DN1706_c0_g1~~TRINITY_DN1706_c0_g1_i2.p1  ORF type:complete len:926 (-),score=308.67 TRINITY_DN1706_c0_g1_i2:140-2917(-)